MSEGQGQGVPKGGPGQRGCPRPLTPGYGAEGNHQVAPSTPDLTLCWKPGHTHPEPRVLAAPLPAYLLQPVHAARRWWSGHSQIPGREGRRRGVKLGPASGRWALGSARPERASHWAVASSSLGDSPGCWPSAGPGRGGRTCQPGRGPISAGLGWGRAAVRAGPGLREQGGRRRAPAFHSLSLGKPVLWTRSGKVEGCTCF